MSLMSIYYYSDILYVLSQSLKSECNLEPETTKKLYNQNWGEKLDWLKGTLLIRDDQPWWWSIDLLLALVVVAVTAVLKVCMEDICKVTSVLFVIFSGFLSTLWAAVVCWWIILVPVWADTVFAWPVSTAEMDRIPQNLHTHWTAGRLSRQLADGW